MTPYRTPSPPDALERRWWFALARLLPAALFSGYRWYRRAVGGHWCLAPWHWFPQGEAWYIHSADPPSRLCVHRRKYGAGHPDGTCEDWS